MTTPKEQLESTEAIGNWLAEERRLGRGETAPEVALGFSIALLMNRGFSSDEIGRLAKAIAEDIMKKLAEKGGN